MHIYLIGFMGVGKTTVGKYISRKLNLPFQDTDALVEKKTGLSLDEIFAKYGEDYFRQKESEVIQELSHQSRCVISTGGGLPCYYNNLVMLLNSGYVVYLNAQKNFLVSRLIASKKIRPLIKNLTQEELLAFVEQKLNQRQSYYLQANLIVDATAKSVQTIAKSVVLGYQAKIKKAM